MPFSIPFTASITIIIMRPIVNSRWPDIAQALFFAFLWTETKSGLTKKEKEGDYYPAILTEQAWSIRDLLCNKIFSHFSESRVPCLFQEPDKKANCVCSK